MKIFDFDDAARNDFLVVREFWVQGDLNRRRVDIAGFVNGIPLLFIECKNIHKDLRHAYERNLADYKDTIPHFFHHNAIIMCRKFDTRLFLCPVFLHRVVSHCMDVRRLIVRRRESFVCVLL